MAAVHRMTEAYRKVIAGLAEPDRYRADVAAVPWLIEELRVSLFAQALGTGVPVSEKRILAALDRIRAGR